MTVLFYIFIALATLIGIFIALYFYGEYLAKKELQKMDYDAPFELESDMKVVHRKKKFKYSGNAYRDFKKKAK